MPKNKKFSPGVSIRLTELERKTIDSAIKRTGLTQSVWARKALLYAAEHGYKFVLASGARGD